MNRRINLLFLIAIVACSVLVITAQPSGPKIILSANCPPGFELTDDNRCNCRTLYDQYSSLQNSGVGGLKTSLPKIRDGFSPQQIDLGRYLFFDPVLSADGSLACSSCHSPEKGFSDGLPTSKGIGGATLKRAAPSLWNAGFLKSFFWDGRASSLEAQMQGPLYSKDEMGNNPDQLLKTLNNIPTYKQLFATAFPKEKTATITLDQIYTAIAAFESSLISLNSKYDLYAHGFHQALNEKEIKGLNIFRSFVARCSECHTPPLFTNQQIAVLGMPEPIGIAFDPGAEVPLKNPSLRGGFKVPSLRNIDKTAPYSHAGKFKTLRETVKFYTEGRGHAVPKGEKLTIHWHVWDPKLTDDEIDRLVDFLKTLTDEGFMPKTPNQLPSGKQVVHS